MRFEPATGHGPVPTATETTTAAVATAITSAVAVWAERSGGRLEARTFALDTDLDPDSVGDTLLALGLESYRQPTSAPGPCPATRAWQQLFTAASGGGARGGGHFGAYGRLLAWQSVAALVGAAPGAAAAEVETLAHACAWHTFAATTDWFGDNLWDIALAVVSSDRRHLTVLAATDSN